MPIFNIFLAIVWVVLYIFNIDSELAVFLKKFISSYSVGAMFVYATVELCKGK
ncbi:hypothetical protein KNT87_gp200 [Erwinia phage Cronus]|uniref:Uncharacterized protein n=1 Tax=Erwinia phage Cronus TaxID=2163633 RepID=A0A2S1GLW9_9CAUD|nr:hypothetical protein KNT87_gp200 [Erwinia phage Cronus]AWD90369.1 hypothetical protein [Erwinia phage Cronus]